MHEQTEYKIKAPSFQIPWHGGHLSHVLSAPNCVVFFFLEWAGSLSQVYLLMVFTLNWFYFYDHTKINRDQQRTILCFIAPLRMLMGVNVLYMKVWDLTRSDRVNNHHEWCQAIKQVYNLVIDFYSKIFICIICVYFFDWSWYPLTFQNKWTKHINVKVHVEH